MAFRRILVTGASGMLGQDLIPYLKAKGYDVTGVSSKEMNLLGTAEVIQKTIDEAAPEIIIHPAAMTNVDEAEKSPELAMAINKDGTRKLVEAARQAGAIFVYVSTDFVFDGNKGAPYTPQDRPNPINAYGLSKYYGELMVSELLEEYYIVRTSWLYGLHRNNFVQSVIEAARQGREIKAATDLVGSPTWTGSLSQAIERIMTSGAFGTYHGCDVGSISRYDQARAICSMLGLSPDHVQKVTTAELPLIARRPAYSAMAVGDLPMPSWETSFQTYFTLYQQQCSANS
jgi:dTDP-4-dehydrorhamnose reductase